MIAHGLALSLALAPMLGCDRAADPLVCGELGAGDLVVTEVRGGPSITDADGQWLELYNASAGTVDLHGLAITIDSVGGSKHDRVLIRRPVMVAAGAYAVVGKFADDGRPAHVDVGWGTAPGLPTSGAIALSCGGDIDQITFTALSDPGQLEAPQGEPPPAGHGTYAYGGVPVTAAANDDTSKWCADPTVTLGPCNQSACLKYFKGSPGEPNPGCTP